MQISGSIRCCTAYPALAAAAMLLTPSVSSADPRPPFVMSSIETDVLEIHGLAVDASGRRRDPARELARLGDPAHQRSDKSTVLLARQPLAHVGLPLGFRQHASVGRHAHSGEGAYLAVECLVRNPQSECYARLLDHLVPALDAADRILDVIVSQALVQRQQRRHLLLQQPVAGQLEHLVGVELAGDRLLEKEVPALLSLNE